MLAVSILVLLCHLRMLSSVEDIYEAFEILLGCVVLSYIYFFKEKQSHCAGCAAFSTARVSLLLFL